MKISIIGIGFVGSAMLNTFVNKRILNDDIYIYDKFKKLGNQENITKGELIFLALPTPFDVNTKKYNIDAIKEILEYISNNNTNNNIIIIKSTVLPGTCEELSNLYNLKIVHNPEFLSAKTANIDFENTNNIVIGRTSKITDTDLDKIKNFYLEYFPNAKYNLSTSCESELMKLSCNSFYAVKIEFFTELFLLSNKLNCSFNKIRDMMLDNNWINKQHTNIPGNDGEISYGGMCFPKDTNALNEFMIMNKTPNKVLDSTVKERNMLRQD